MHALTQCLCCCAAQSKINVAVQDIAKAERAEREVAAAKAAAVAKEAEKPVATFGCLCQAPRLAE